MERCWRDRPSRTCTGCSICQYIEPELREDSGEIEAAIKGTLPEIVPYTAVKGDLHVHSAWSDGKQSIRELADAAKALGYEYIAICDHAWNPKIARGLDETAIAKQQKEIEQVNREARRIHGAVRDRMQHQS